MLLKLKARVKLISEADMEVDAMDLDINSFKSAKWVYRTVAIPSEEVYKVISYSPQKTIVQMYDRENILVAEPFEEVFYKWERALKSTIDEEEEQENNEKSENFDEEDEL